MKVRIRLGATTIELARSTLTTPVSLAVFAFVFPVLYLWPAQLSVLVAVLLSGALGALLLR